MSLLECRIVRLEDVILVIIQEIEPIWLKAMWDEDGET
jgi:hypothetical protein